MENFFKNVVLSIIEDMEESDKITLHNEYCEHNNDYESRLNSYDDIDDIFDGLSPSKIVNKFNGACVGYNNYWYFNGYGEVEVMDDIDEFLDTTNIVYSILEGDSYSIIYEYDELFIIQQLSECIDSICEEIVNSLKDNETNIKTMSFKEFEVLAEEVINDNIYNYEPIEGFINTLREYILTEYV